MIKNFIIPLNKDELLQTTGSGQYYVEKIIPIRMIPQALNEARTAFQTNGINFITEHFDTFFSVVVHGNKIDLPIIMKGFTGIHKAIEMLIYHLEGIFEKENELEEENRLQVFNITKMLGYLFSWFFCHIDEEILKTADNKYIEKRKKNTKSDLEEEWDSTKEKALEYCYRLLQLPLQKLWQPPIVEDSFIILLTKMCYKVLEQCKNIKQKYIRQTVFEILGTSIKKYNHGINCIIRIIQLVKVSDMLASHIATGVIQMINECGCNGLIKEVMKEIDQSEPSENDGHYISIFLETIATTQPDLIMPILDDVRYYLDSEHYAMRNCTIVIIGVIVRKSLNGDNLTQEQKDKRDECLNSLEEHLLDNNAYVRSKVLQVWQHLCCEGAIPLARQGKLLAATALRLEDKSANVRKQALQLLRALLQANPYAAKLNKVEISKSLEENKMKLRKMQTDRVSKSVCGDRQRLELWDTLLPNINKTLKEVVACKKKDKEQSDEDDENDDDEENIDPNIGFEHVRQLMLKEQISEAVTYLWKVYVKLTPKPDKKNFSSEAIEEFLFLLLLKIFMESEDKLNNVKADANTAQSSDKDKSNDEEEITATKRVVNYLKNCLEFATELETAITKVENLLFSTTAGDAIEACTFLGTAYQFGIAGAVTAIRDALDQVFHHDQSVRKNVAIVYKEIYLNNNVDKISNRQKAVMRVKALIALLKELQPGQSQALNKLIVEWYTNKELSNEEIQVLWEKFSMKSSDKDPLDSRSALMLITMIAQTESDIITTNLNILIKVGLGPRAKTDLLLARDTCRALLKIKSVNDDINKSPVRYPNDHEMFKEILSLLIENFTNMEEDGYVSFATDAVSAIYCLANQPDHLMQQLLLEVYNRGQFNNIDSTEHVVSLFLLSKLLYLIGHIAARQMVHLDTSVYKELKRRDTIRKLKKEKNSNRNKCNSSKSRWSKNTLSTSNSARRILRNKETSIVAEDNGEEAVVGAIDDSNAELINDVLENHIVTGDGLLAKFVPVVLHVCQNHDKYNDEDTQAASTLALSKMMTVSSIFCEESLQLLITILERSPHPAIRANVLIGVSDLTSRFPNQVEPWMKHIYSRLRDTDKNVRSTCVHVLSSLIMRDMVRVRGQISELALCIVDKDTQIRQDAKQFFKALSQKTNALYNVMPDILSRLTDPNLDIGESDFQEIIKYILSLLQKEKQVDAIIDKICTRFQLATTERQWRDFSYCLSLLQFGPKSIHRLTESLPLLKEKIHHKHVQKALQTVIEQSKKKPNTKAVCIELEEKIKELLKSTNEESNNEMMPPPQVPKPKKRNRQSKYRSSSEEDSDSDIMPMAKPKSARKVKSRSRTNKASSDSDSDTDSTLKKTRGERQAKATPSKPSARKLSNRSENTNPVHTTRLSVSRRNRNSATPVYTSQRTSARLSQSRGKHSN